MDAQPPSPADLDRTLAGQEDEPAHGLVQSAFDDIQSESGDHSIPAVSPSQTETSMVEVKTEGLTLADELMRTEAEDQNDEETCQSPSLSMVSLDNKPATESGKSQKDLIEYATGWKDAIQSLIESPTSDYGDLKKCLSTIKDEMTQATTDHSDRLAEAAARITELTTSVEDLTARNRQLSLQQKQLEGFNKTMTSTSTSIDPEDQKKERRVSTNYMEDAEMIAWHSYNKKKVHAEPNNFRIPNSNRSAGWASQTLPKVQPPLPPLHIPRPQRQRSVGREWKRPGFEAPRSKRRSHLQSSAEISPDTPQPDLGDTDSIGRSSIFWARGHGSMASIPQSPSSEAPSPISSNSSMAKASPERIQLFDASQELQGSTEAGSPTRPVSDDHKSALLFDECAPSGTFIHEDGKDDEALSQGVSTRKFELAPNWNSIEPQSRKVECLLDNNFDLPSEIVLDSHSMATPTGGKNQGKDDGLDTEYSEKTTKGGPMSPQSPMVGQNKDFYGIMTGVLVFLWAYTGPLLKLAYIGLFIMTVQIYVASLRQQRIWLTANGLTREYMLKTYVETPSWMLVPGVDGGLTLGLDETIVWLWQALPWNTSVAYNGWWLWGTGNE